MKPPLLLNGRAASFHMLIALRPVDSVPGEETLRAVGSAVRVLGRVDLAPPSRAEMNPCLAGWRGPLPRPSTPRLARDARTHAPIQTGPLLQWTIHRRAQHRNGRIPGQSLGSQDRKRPNQVLPSHQYLPTTCCLATDRRARTPTLCRWVWTSQPLPLPSLALPGLYAFASMRPSRHRQSAPPVAAGWPKWEHRRR